MPAFNIRLKPNQDTQCSLSQNLCPSVCSDCRLARKNPKMSNLNLFFLPASVCIIKKNITSIVRTENCGNLNFTHAAIHQMQGHAQHNNFIALGLGLYSSKLQESYGAVTKISNCRVNTTSG